MRIIGILIGVVMLPIFWPASFVIWLMCLIPPKPQPQRDRVGDIRTFMGHRLILGEDGQWYRLD